MSSTLKNCKFFLISDSADLYLRDVYDHSAQVSEMLNTSRIVIWDAGYISLYYEQ